MASNGPDKYKYNMRQAPTSQQQQQHSPGLPPPPPPDGVQRLPPHVELANRLWRTDGSGSKHGSGGSCGKTSVMVSAADTGNSGSSGTTASKDSNQRVQGYASELRELREVNRRYQEDNQELRDLCCFLDDDRQKGRKLAREWQRFGRYTASVMRQEVSTYQAKLRELESRQQELIKDNLELKELCLYLDEERVGSRGATQLCSNCSLALQQGHRDEGDGSSSSTNNDEAPSQYPPVSYPLSLVAGGSRERLLEDSLQRQKGIMNEQALQYIRGLEKRIQQLEEEKTFKRQTVDGERLITKPLQPPPYRKPPCPPVDSTRLGRVNAELPNNYGKPEAVVHAMKVLEVHEQIEKAHPSDHDDLADGERALLREMCNVVWKKLEDGSENC